MSGAAGKRHQSGKTTARIELMSTFEELHNKEDLLNPDNLPSLDSDQKIDLLIEAVRMVNNKFIKVHEMVNDASDGLDPRFTDCEDRVQLMAEENKQLRFELDIVKGLLVKAEEDKKSLKDKVTMLTAQSMKDNIVINGICGDEATEDTAQATQDFLNDKMGLEFPSTQIRSARRFGGYIHGKPEIPRPIRVQVHPDLRELIFANVGKLKGKKNERKRSYNISKQLPEQWMEERRQLNAEVQKVKKANEQKGEDQQKDDITVKNRILYVNRVPQKKVPFPAPGPVDLFPDKTEQDKLDKIKYATSTVVEESGSAFQAFAIKLQSITEVKRAYVRVRQLHPGASHVIAAYSIKSYEGHQDDFEHGASHRLLNVIANNSFNNIAVYVVRYHQGPNLGPKRHQLYEKVATEALARIKK